MSPDSERIEALAKRLVAVRPPAEPGNPDPPEWILAWDLIEIEQVCLAYLERFPRLLDASEDNAEAVEDAFHEIREEVQYHIRLWDDLEHDNLFAESEHRLWSWSVGSIHEEARRRD